jgi:hypothetical protein
LQVDVAAAIGDRRAVTDVGPALKMRTGKRAVWVGLSVTLAGAFSLLAAGAEAQTVPLGTRIAQATVATEPQLVRPPRRLRIYPRYQAEPDGVYPRYYPGPNAVRVCNATYAQEYRPSGTVIVPHMSCVWRRG